VTKASEFIRNAKSVRVQVVDKESGPKARSVEIVCPDKVRITAETTSGRLEIVAVGQSVVARTGDSPWIKAPMSFVNAPAICTGSPWAGQRKDLATVFEGLTKLVITEVLSDPRDVNGIRCQDWQARERGPDASGTKPRVRFCLGVEDNRPMGLALPDGTSFVFTDWNNVGDIALPPQSQQAGPSS
jgi:hypothetical protein